MIIDVKIIPIIYQHTLMSRYRTSQENQKERPRPPPQPRYNNAGILVKWYLLLYAYRDTFLVAQGSF